MSGACPNCGSVGGKMNLISRYDYLTQHGFLQEDGYFFQNRWWNDSFIPSPEYFNELIDELHSDVKEELLGGSLRVVNLPHFRLFAFDYFWIYGTSIVARLSIEGLEHWSRSTFFLRPYNERLPDWFWFRDVFYNCWKKAGYVWNSKKKDYDDIRKRLDKEKKEYDKPNKFHLDFLKATKKLVVYYFDRFVHSTKADKRGKERGIYTEDFLKETKDNLKPYDLGGKYDNLKLPDYIRIRQQFLKEGLMLISHIEKKIKNTKGKRDIDDVKGRWTPDSYQLFTPVHFTKVNDDRLIIELERDVIALWYPRLLDILAVWIFHTRPFTKELIENWNGEGEPLESCVFCPSDVTSSSFGADDYVLDRHPILVSSSTDKPDFKNWNKEWKSLEELRWVHYFTEFLVGSSSEQELKKVDLKLLNNVRRFIDTITGDSSFPDSTRASLRRSREAIEKEIERRIQTEKDLKKLNDQYENLLKERDKLTIEISSMNKTIINLRHEWTRAMHEQRKAELSSEIDIVNGSLREHEATMRNLGNDIIRVNASLKNELERR